MTDVWTKVERTIREEKLLFPGDRIIAAVSGGPDSVAMLHLLARMADVRGWRMAVAHVNHQFRGEESEEEAAFVESLAASLGLSCRIARIDVPEWVRRTGANAQEVAREARYRFLREAAEADGAGKIALAHHADDQAETVLMRLLRGSGASGLSGMPIRRAEGSLELIRPMLRIYKQDLVELCAARGWEYRTDSSNLSTKYVRNRIRLELMPQLREYNPQLPEALNRLAGLLREDDDCLEREAQRIVDGWPREKTVPYALSRKEFLPLHVALQRRCIKLILKYVFADGDSSDYTTVEAVREALLQEAKPSLRLNLPGGCTMVREYDRVVFSRGRAVPAHHAGEPQPVLWNETNRSGTVRWDSAVTLAWELRDTRPNEGWQPMSDGEAAFDADQLKTPLLLRARRPGDRMKPFGLNGSKKVKDMYIDDKIPPSLRRRLPLLVDAEGEILWIPGMRRSRHAPVGKTTSRILYMKVFIEWKHSGSHSIY